MGIKETVTKILNGGGGGKEAESAQPPQTFSLEGGEKKYPQGLWQKIGRIALSEEAEIIELKKDPTTERLGLSSCLKKWLVRIKDRRTLKVRRTYGIEENEEGDLTVKDYHEEGAPIFFKNKRKINA